MARRDGNQVKTDTSRIETTGGMIGDLILRGEQVGEHPSLKSDHDRSTCQAFQLIRVFGTDSLWVSTRLCCPSFIMMMQASECRDRDHSTRF
jgi:hypothetical protein